MIEINLLGKTERRARALPTLPRVGTGALRLPGWAGDPWMAGLGAAGALLLVLGAYGFWRTGAQQSEWQARLEEARQDSTQLAQTLSLAEQIKARRDSLARRIEIVRQLDGRRYVWPHILDEVSKALPAYTWLTRLAGTESTDTASRAATGPTITIEGSTGSTQALTRFMKALEASPFLRDVTLVTSAQATEGGRTFQRFTLELKYETPIDSSVIVTVPLVPRR